MEPNLDMQFIKKFVFLLLYFTEKSQQFLSLHVCLWARKCLKSALHNFLFSLFSPDPKSKKHIPT